MLSLLKSQINAFLADYAEERMRSVKEDLKSNSANVRPINIDVAMKTEERNMQVVSN